MFYCAIYSASVLHSDSMKDSPFILLFESFTILLLPITLALYSAVKPSLVTSFFTNFSTCLYISYLHFPSMESTSPSIRPRQSSCSSQSKTPLPLLMMIFSIGTLFFTKYSLKLFRRFRPTELDSFGFLK
jgi:cytochrome bd-type quinol oxidase subunit 2